MGYGYPTAISRPLWLFRYYNSHPNTPNPSASYPPPVVMPISGKKKNPIVVRCECVCQCNCSKETTMSSTTTTTTAAVDNGKETHWETLYHRAMASLMGAMAERDDFYHKWTVANAELVALRTVCENMPRGSGYNSSSVENSVVRTVVDDSANAALRAEIDRLIADLDRAHREIRELRSENGRLADEMERRRAADARTIAELQAELQAANLSRAALDADNQNKARLIAQLQAEIAALQQQVRDLEAGNQSKNREIASLQDEIARLKRRLADTEDELHRANAKLLMIPPPQPPQPAPAPPPQQMQMMPPFISLTAPAPAPAPIIAPPPAPREPQFVIPAGMELVLSAELARLRNEAAELARAKEANEQLREKLRAKKKEIEDLRRELKSLKGMEKWKKKYAALKADHEKLKLELDAKIRENKELRDELARLRAQLEAQDRRIRELEAELAQLRAENQRLNQDNTRLKGENDDLNRRIAALLAELNAEREKTKSLMIRIEELERILASTNSLSAADGQALSAAILGFLDSCRGIYGTTWKIKAVI